MRNANKEVLYGLYDDEEVLLKAVVKAQHEHRTIMDVFTPFPVHGLDPALGLSESRLHIAGFVYGAIGTLTALLFMTWVFTRDWPIIFGGKPYFSLPAFIPITFEVTVLFASIGMVVTFYTICGMAPGVTNPTLDDRITDDKFCIAFDVTNADADEKSDIQSFLSGSGASEVNTKNI
ncbi:MAG TPA: DUF3341 domain-containing protein [Saprospiraceae bacterium]|nr:DUF3341 domain-containing protein [Saprospiraceae bacterium]HMQ84646.1 DUF3341 domain-containing protein [Saprospiraceae bacterium]